MFFKPKQEPNYCAHSWEAADIQFYEREHFDTETEYILGCTKCKTTRRVGEYEYNVMVRTGFITERGSANDQAN